MFHEQGKILNLETTLQILKSWPAQNLRLVVDELNNTGIVTDEDNTGLSSYMVKRWDDGCTLFLISKGYTGGNIQRVGAFTDVGNVYALFDEDRFDGYEVYKKLLKRFTVSENSI